MPDSPQRNCKILHPTLDSPQRYAKFWHLTPDSLQSVRPVFVKRLFVQRSEAFSFNPFHPILLGYVRLGQVGLGLDEMDWTKRSRMKMNWTESRSTASEIWQNLKSDILHKIRRRDVAKSGTLRQVRYGDISLIVLSIRNQLNN